MKCCEELRPGDYHCATGCHQTFSSLELFYKHQDVNYNRIPVVVCRPPAALGLAQNDRGLWQFTVTPSTGQSTASPEDGA